MTPREKLDLIMFGYLGAGRPGWKRPLIVEQSPAEIGVPDAAGVFHEPTRAVGMSKDETRRLVGGSASDQLRASRGGIILHSSSADMSGAAIPGFERKAYGDGRKASRVVLRHELVHALRNPSNYAANSKSRKSMGSAVGKSWLGDMREEAAAYKRSMFGKGAKGLGPLRDRVRLFVAKMASQAGAGKIAERLMNR